MSFKKFVKSDLMDTNRLIRIHSRPQNLYVEYKGELFVDFIGRFENISKDDRKHLIEELNDFDMENEVDEISNLRRRIELEVKKLIAKG